MADGLKEKYLDFIESLREKGVPAPQILIPLVIIIVIAAAIFVANPYIQQAISPVQTGSVTIMVKDQAGAPVANAMVTLVYSANGSSFNQGVAGSDGKVSFDGVPIDGSIEAKATASGFQPKNTQITNKGEMLVNLAAVSAPVQMKEFKVTVRGKDGKPVESAYVTLSFDDGSSTALFTDAAGGAPFPLDKDYSHATVKIEAPGFVTLEQSVGATDLAKGTVEFATEPTVQATPTPGAVEKGTLRVKVSSEGAPVKGAKVKLVDVADNEFQSGLTGEDGVAAFSDMLLGKQFVVKVTANSFLDKQTSDYITFTADGQTEQVFLERKMAGTTSFVTVSVQDAQSAAIAGAELNFFFKDSNKLARKEISDDSGQVKFEAAKGISFYATAYKAGFLPAFVESVKPGDSKTVTLAEEVAGSVATLSIKVLMDAMPAGNAQVSLYREGGFFLGVPSFNADEAGLATVSVPTQFNNAGYKLYAKAVAGTATGQSDLTELNAQTSEANVSLMLRSPPAALNVKVADLANGKPVPGASTQILVAGNPVDSCTTASDGSCKYPVAAKIAFTYSVKASGYLPFVSNEITMESASFRNETASLYPLASGVRAQFLGLFNARGKAEEVANAERYSAKFVVNVPSASEQAGIYVRLGDKATVADEVAYISDYDKSAADIVYSGSSYDAASQCPSETTGAGDELKWVLLMLPRGFVGTKEVSFTVAVRRTAGANDSLNFAYRAFAVRNNTAFFYPNDADLAQELLTKSSSANSSLGVSDYCRAKTSAATVPVTSQPLICSEGGELCYKFYFEADGVKAADGFQATLGKEFTLHYEVLSDSVIDSMALSGDYLKVTGYSSQAAKFAGEETTTTLTTVQKVVVNSKPGIKSAGTVNLKPLRATQAAGLAISFSSPATITLPQVQLQFSVSGTNTFKVSVSPQSLKVADKRKLTVTVTDKFGQPATDATVSLFECDGTPFGGNEPSAIVGDDTTSAGEDGKYVFKANAVGIGTVGVRVSRDDSRTYEECSLPVTAVDFLSVSPESLSFEGDSSKAEKQQLSLSSSLPDPVHVSATVDCFGDAKPIKVFPTTFNLKQGSDSTLTVKVIENVTSNSQCVVRIVGRVTPEIVSELEVPVDVRVSCPNCPAVSETGAVVGPSSLPPAITLTIDPYYKRDSKTYSVSLATDPVGCQISGFRIDPYSQYNAQSAAYTGGGLGGLWGCQSCGAGAGIGSFNCFNCMLNTQLPTLCQQCSAGAYPAGSFYCTGCNSMQGGLAVSGYYNGASPQAQWGASGSFAMPVGQQGMIGVGGSYGTPGSVGFGGSYGTPYSQGFVSNPAWGYPYNSQYPTSLSQLDTAAYEDAVVVEECTKNSITVTADYRGRQPMPGVGSLVVSLGGGQKRTIPLNVVAGTAQVGPAMGGQFFTGGIQVPYGVSPYYQNNYGCNIDSSYEYGPFDVNEKEDFTFNKEIEYSCPYPFDLNKFSASVGAVTFSDACKIKGTQAGQKGKLSISCLFSKSALAKLKEGRNEIEMSFDLSSSKQPGATLSGTVKFVFTKKYDAEKDQLLKVVRPSGDAVCNIVNGKDSVSGTQTVDLGSFPELSYHFPAGSTGQKMYLMEAQSGKPLTAADKLAAQGPFEVSAAKNFQPATSYSWKMSYSLEGEQKTYVCTFQTSGAKQDTPTEGEVPPSVKSFCETPSMHPIRNIVVYNEAQGHKVVRQSDSSSHFSNVNSPAKVAVCVRTDTPNVGKPRVVFIENDASLSKNIDNANDQYSNVGFTCRTLTIDGKSYAYCESDTRPASEFKATKAGTFVAVVDASALISSFYDGAPKSGSVAQYVRRFYCNGWPLDNRAKSTVDKYGLGSGTQSDAAIYPNAGGNEVGYACNAAEVSRVKFGVGSAPKTATPAAAGGTTTTPASGDAPAFTVVSQEGLEEISFATTSAAAGSEASPFELKLLQVRFEKDSKATVSLVDSKGSATALATFSGAVMNTVPFDNGLNKVGKLKMEVVYNGKTFVYWANGAPKAVGFSKENDAESKANYYKLVGAASGGGTTTPPAGGKTLFDTNCAPAGADKNDLSYVKCKFTVGQTIDFPGGYSIELYEISDRPLYDPLGWGTGHNGKAYFRALKDGQELDCDALPGFRRGDLRLNAKDSQYCWFGGELSWNEYTPFLKVDFINDGVGSTPLAVNLTVTTFFSTSEDWLPKYYSYQTLPASYKGKFIPYAQSVASNGQPSGVFRMKINDLTKVDNGYFVSFKGTNAGWSGPKGETAGVGDQGFSAAMGTKYFFEVRDPNGVIEDCETSIGYIYGGQIVYVAAGAVVFAGSTALAMSAPLSVPGSVLTGAIVGSTAAAMIGSTVTWIESFDAIYEEASMSKMRQCGVGSTTGVKVMPLKSYSNNEICVVIRSSQPGFLESQKAEFTALCP